MRQAAYYNDIDPFCCDRLEELIVVAENVGGLISMRGGSVLDEVYASLGAEGYEILPPFVVPASSFGAGHRRDRIWIIAHSKSHLWGASGDDMRIASDGSGSGPSPNSAILRRDERREGSGPQVQRQRQEREGHAIEESRTYRQLARELERSCDDVADPALGEDRRIQLARVSANHGAASQDDPNPDDKGSQRRPLYSQCTSEQASWAPRLDEYAAVSRLPDWAGGTLGQPWPLTQFERRDGIPHVRTGHPRKLGQQDAWWKGYVERVARNRYLYREIERDFRGVAYGVSARVDPLKSLGNAIVPEIAEWIARNILSAERPRAIKG